MEKKEKTGKFGKSVLWTILSYVVISVIAAVCTMIRGMVQGEENGVTFWMIVELLLIPALFVLAGYLGTAKCEFEKFKTYKVWLFSVVFSLVLLGLWYVLLEAYVLLNLPVAEGICALDLFLRRSTIVRDYEVLFLSQTDAYRYGILPGIHFAVRIVYWLLYMWGNRIGVSKRGTGIK